MHTVAAGLTIGVVCSGVSAPTPANAAAPSIRTVSASGLPYQLAGVIADESSTLGVADSQLYTMSQQDIDTTLDNLNGLGVKDIRIGVPWLYIQPSATGDYDWSKLDYIVSAADQRGMNILGVINGTPAWAGTPIISGQPDNAAFATFATAVASRYKGHIDAYEIWNEPNGVTGMAPVSATAYTALLKAGYAAIKGVDSDITVVGGVLGSTSNVAGITVDPVTFVQQMYAAGAKGYFDALSYHPYNYTLPFSLGADVTNSPLQQLTSIRALMVANDDGNLKVWVSEYGLPTNLVSQDQQAAYIKDFVGAWQGQDGAGPVFIYSTRDIDTGNWNSEGNFGIFQTNWTEKPAAEAIAEMIEQFNNGSFTPTLIDASDYKEASYYLGALILTTELFSVGAILPTAASQLIGGLVAAVGTVAQQAIQGAGQLGYQIAGALKPVVPAPIFDAVESVAKTAGALGLQLQDGLHTVAVNAFNVAQHITNDVVRLTIQATAGVLAAVAQTVTTIEEAGAKLNPVATPEPDKQRVVAVAAVSDAAEAASPDESSAGDTTTDTAADAKDDVRERVRAVRRHWEPRVHREVVASVTAKVSDDASEKVSDDISDQASSKESDKADKESDKVSDRASSPSSRDNHANRPRHVKRQRGTTVTHSDSTDGSVSHRTHQTKSEHGKHNSGKPGRHDGAHRHERKAAKSKS